MNKVFGYARVSTDDQKLHMQIDALTKYGCNPKDIYEEKLSGTKKDRPQLEALLKVARTGDKVIVYKLDRISRSTKHLIELVDYFEKEGIDFVSINDNIDTSTAMGKFFFRTIASIAELERDIISERTKSGLQAARARGKLGGRPSIKNEKVTLALKMYDDKYSIDEILKATGMSKMTLYRYINKREQESNG